MSFKPGDSFRALDTRENRKAGVLPGAAGEVASILGAKISFTVERGGPGEGILRAHSDAVTFHENFALDKSKETARRTEKISGVHPQRFPNDFLK